REALRARDHVGLEAVRRRREHVADAPEARNDLVGDEQHIVLIADLAHALKVSRWRREATARVLHRFEEDRRDRVWPFEEDHLLDAVRGPLTEALERAAFVPLLGRAIEVGVRHAEPA